MNRNLDLSSTWNMDDIVVLGKKLARSDARESWPAVVLYFSPIFFSPSTSLRIFGRFSLEYLVSKYKSKAM